MTFAPLQTSTLGDRVADAGVQRPRSCSPRSVYSLAKTVDISFACIIPSADTVGKLGIKNFEEDALKSIQSELTTSNIVQELFSSFAARWASSGLLFFFFSHLNLLRSQSGLGYGDPGPLRNVYRKGSQIAHGSYPKDGVWGGTLLFHNAEFGLRQGG